MKAGAKAAAPRARVANRLELRDGNDELVAVLDAAAFPKTPEGRGYAPIPLAEWLKGQGFSGTEATVSDVAGEERLVRVTDPWVLRVNKRGIIQLRAAAGSGKALPRVDGVTRIQLSAM